MKTALTWRPRLAIALLALLAPACNILIALGNGAGLPCVDDTDCEPALICISQVCTVPDAGTGLDGNRYDAMQPRRDAGGWDMPAADRRRADAARPDVVTVDANDPDAADSDGGSEDVWREDGGSEDVWREDGGSEDVWSEDGGSGDAPAADL